MKHILLCLTALIATPALSDQASQAAQIASLSTTAGFERSEPRPTAMILLDGCVITIASTSQNKADGLFLAYSVEGNLEDVSFGLPDAQVPFSMVDANDEGLPPYGTIPVLTDVGLISRTHGAIPGVLPPQDAITYPVVYTTELNQWSHTMLRATEAQMATLATALVSYQQDFCTPAS